MMKKAFTLAEVLITLGIIGVVAAMTMPTLMSNTQGAQFKTAFKKELSTLNQAVLMQFAMQDTDFSNLIADTGANANSDNGIMMSGILSSRLQAATDITTSYPSATATASYNYTIQHTCTPEQAALADGAEGAVPGCNGKAGEQVKATMSKAMAANSYYAYSFADGTSFVYPKAAHDCTGLGVVEAHSCYGFLDVNGITKPNQVTACTKVEGGTATTCDASEIHDIFPVVFYGQTMEAATASGRAILTNK